VCLHVCVCFNVFFNCFILTTFVVNKRDIYTALTFLTFLKTQSWQDSSASDFLPSIACQYQRRNDRGA